MLKANSSSQGTVYQRIMDDVIENCQTTFEEDGVNQQTLDDLRKVCLIPSCCPSWSIVGQQMIIVVVDSSSCIVFGLNITSSDPSGSLQWIHELPD